MKRALPVLTFLLISCAAVQLIKKEAGMAVDPATNVRGGHECKRMESQEVPWDEEHDIGGALALSLASGGRGLMVSVDAGVPRPNTTTGDQLHAAVAEVGLTVARFSTRPELPWTFGVIDSPNPNAFSAPGGYVFVTKGLLKQLRNESQLAGVLAHEIGHIALKHALKVYRTSKVAQCYADKAREQSVGGMKVATSDGKSIVDGNALSKKAFVALIDPTIDAIVSKGYAQGDEYDADAYALELLLMAGYQPSEYQALLLNLPSEKGLFPNHPSGTERAGKIAERISAEWADFAPPTGAPVPLDARITKATAR